MQSNGARIAVLAVAVGVVVALFLVLSRDDEEETTAVTTPASTTTQTEEPAPDKPDKPKPKPEPKPEVAIIAVEGGQPVGGVQKLTFTAGEDIVFKVRSDTAAEVHFHGYDVIQDVVAGGEVTFDVPADIEGVFEVELEETATPIAEISVTPG